MNNSTQFARIAGAPCSADQDRLDALAADLADARYLHDDVTALLGENAHESLGRDQTIPALIVIRRELAQREPRPLAVVVGLWLLGVEVDAALLDAALPRTGHAGLLELGLIEELPGNGPAIQAEAAGAAGRTAGQGRDAAGRTAAVQAPGQVPEQAGRDKAEAGLPHRAAVDLRPYASDADGQLWVASDLGAHQRAGVLRHDHVLGIGPASLTLAQTTIRRPVDRALDLGTGCGIQTFHLLSHARQVVATDVSERALAFTRFNLLLNREALGIDPLRLGDRVDLRRGSLLEPVAGESFDLVVSNPPFVITPRAPGESDRDRFTYRDGGLPGDSLVASLVAGLPSVLAPGGTAQLLANWEIRAAPEPAPVHAPAPEHASAPEHAPEHAPAPERAQPGNAPVPAPSPAEAAWIHRVRGWVPGGAEAWFIQRETATPEVYAETWLRDASQARDGAAYEAAYTAYLEDFASRGVHAIGFGMVWLRRPAVPGGPGFGTRFEEITYPIEQPIAPHLAAEIAAADALAIRPVREMHLVVADDVTEERHQRPGAEHPGVILLRQGAGLRRTTLLSSEEAGFVSACDGELDTDALARGLASLVDGDPVETVDRLLASVIRLVTTGFLSEIRNNS